jgi:undecaprenyl-diphosphatase
MAAWLALRFDARRPNGLPLTLLVAVAVSSTWVTLGLTQDVLAHEGIAVFDLHAHSWVLQHRIGWLTAVLRVLTWLGSNAVILPVLAVSCVLLSRLRHSWRPALDIAVVYVWTVILYSVIKDALQRPRPPVADWLTGAGGWSFPSGHSAQATAAWGILCVLACVGRTARQKARLVAGAAAIIVLVAASRWYLGVHWLTDVLAGMTLGVAVLSLWGVARTTIITAEPDSRPNSSDTGDTGEHRIRSGSDAALPATGGSGDRRDRG